MDPSGISPNLNPDRKIINRIPGQVTSPSPKEKDGYIDLKKMSVPTLKELHQRQVGILSNRFIVSKLADKGEKVSLLKKQIENELKNRDDVNKTAHLLSQMTLQQLNELEWTSSVNPGHINLKPKSVEDGVDEQDPLHIIATHSGVYKNEKLKIEQSNETLITQADLEDIAESTSNRVVSPVPSTSSSVTSDLEAYTVRMCEKYDQTTGKERFKPYKSLKSNDNSKCKGTSNIDKKKSSLWEESSAAPPLPVHGDTKLLSLQESLAIQLEQTEKLKIIQTKHAAERLMALEGFKADTRLAASISTSMSFRDKRTESGDSEDEESDSASDEHEVYDEEPGDGPTVVCTVFT